MCTDSPIGDIDEMLKELENSIGTIAHKNRETFILGDFNINFKENSEEKQKLNSCLKELGLNQLITEDTRYQINLIPVIDLIFTNCNFLRKSEVKYWGISYYELI